MMMAGLSSNYIREQKRELSLPQLKSGGYGSKSESRVQTAESYALKVIHNATVQNLPSRHSIQIRKEVSNNDEITQEINSRPMSPRILSRSEVSQLNTARKNHALFTNPQVA